MVNISQVYIPMYVTETLNLDKVRFKHLLPHTQIPQSMLVSYKAVPLWVLQVGVSVRVCRKYTAVTPLGATVEYCSTLKVPLSHYILQ